MVNEGEFLEMTNHFKEVVEKKDAEILQLKKDMMLIYGLIRASDENWEDIHFVELIRDYASTFCSKFLEK